MALKSEIADVMSSRGFKPFKRIDSEIRFTRSRQEGWTNVFYFQLKSRAMRVSVLFGIENASVRSLALAAAAAISPKAYSAMAAPPFTILKDPNINRFSASMEDHIDHFGNNEIDEELIEFIEKKFFEPIDSNARYLTFLKASTGMFDWRSSAAPFRLIYLGYLHRLEGMTAAEFGEFCLSIPRKSLDSHMLLSRDGWTAETYVDACIDRIWVKSGTS